MKKWVSSSSVMFQFLRHLICPETIFWSPLDWLWVFVVNTVIELSAAAWASAVVLSTTVIPFSESFAAASLLLQHCQSHPWLCCKASEKRCWLNLPCGNSQASILLIMPIFVLSRLPCTALMWWNRRCILVASSNAGSCLAHVMGVWPSRVKQRIWHTSPGGSSGFSIVVLVQKLARKEFGRQTEHEDSDEQVDGLSSNGDTKPQHGRVATLDIEPQCSFPSRILA